MMPATIWRDTHNPHACWAGSTALICRNVNALTSAAARDRSDPRAGTPSVMRFSQQKMATLVNGKVAQPASGARAPLAAKRLLGHPSRFI